LTSAFSRACILGAVILAAVVIAVPAGRRPLWSSDEARYALLAQDILDRGHWLVAQLRGQPYLNKPQLFFWTVAGVSLPFGRVSEASAAIPALISSLVAVLGVMAVGRLLWGWQAGVVAGLLLVTTPFHFEMSHQVLPDVMLNAWLVWALYWLLRAERETRARDMLALVGLSRFARHYPHQLSGGMKQRVGIARALANDPEVLLMDEPFAALDAQTRTIMQEELLRIWASLGTTVIYVTHSLEEALLLGDRVVLMTARPGRVSQVFPVDLGRPRGLEIRGSPAYGVLLEKIWSQLRDEVVRAMDADRDP